MIDCDLMRPVHLAGVATLGLITGKHRAGAAIQDGDSLLDPSSTIISSGRPETGAAPHIEPMAPAMPRLNEISRRYFPSGVKT